MHRLLITGGSGFVGKGLASFFATSCPVITTFYQHPIPGDSIQLDITDADAVSLAFEQVKPTAVIHAAGSKNVRFCEEQEAEAFRINALGTQNVARACREVGAQLIYLSTDLVFEGSRGNYKEAEIPEPSLAYGRTKLQGERFAGEELSDVAICRSAGIYGKDAPLLGWFLTEARAGRQVDCFVDVFNTPTYLDNLAEMLEVVIRKRLAGTFHTVGRERVSRFEFFRLFAEVSEVDTGLLRSVSMTQLEETLLLQPDSSLSSRETSERLGIKFNSVAEGFARLKANGGM